MSKKRLLRLVRWIKYSIGFFKEMVSSLILSASGLLPLNQNSEIQVIFLLIYIWKVGINFFSAIYFLKHYQHQAVKFDLMKKS